MNPTVLFLHGGAATACVIAGVLFLTYWRDSHDRLFLFFTAAFWVLGLNWMALGMLAPAVEVRHWLHAVRVVAFALIAIGIIDKNRRQGP